MEARRVTVKYVRNGQEVVFTREPDRLLERWGEGHDRILFKSALPEDLRLRMEHRDEVLRRQGFEPETPWVTLFEVDLPSPQD
jgi:hypothetical protein